MAVAALCATTGAWWRVGTVVLGRGSSRWLSCSAPAGSPCCGILACPTAWGSALKFDVVKKKGGHVDMGKGVSTFLDRGFVDEGGLAMQYASGSDEET